MEELQDAILTAARTALPGLAQAEVYDGQFDAEGPTQGLVIAPALFLAVLEAPYAQEQPGDERVALDARLAAYCLARNARGRGPRGRQAMSMALTFAQQVPEAQWGLAPEVMHARLDTARNLYSPGLANKGFALWEVSWRQVVLLGDSVWDGDDETPTEIWVGFNPESYPGDYEEQPTDA